MPSNTPNTPAAPLTMPAAFERLKARIESIQEEILIPLNVDVMLAVVTARGTARRVQALLPDIARELPHFDTKVVMELDEIALACGFASSRHTLALAPSDFLSEMAQKGIRTRDVLTTDAKGCIKRGLLDPSTLNGLENTTGYRAIAHDVMLLSGLLRGAKETLGARISTTDEELDEADVLCATLTDQVTLRENAPLIVADAAKTRLRAFTLLVRTYSEVRRAVSYVRWQQEDVDLFAPSLYAGRSKKKKEAEATVQAKAEDAEDAEAVDVSADPSPAFVGMPGGSPLS